jgi:solute carrier family 35 protein E1
MAGGKGASDSVALALSFVFWYVGNVFYNVYNQGALVAAGGKNAGLTMTVSTMQLAVCALYAVIVWVVRTNPIKLLGLQAPESQTLPKLTALDLVKTLPVGICSAGAHSSSVFALGGDPLFGQIVKAGEPVIAALVNTVFYGKAPGFTKVLCLPIIVGGVAFASLKKSASGSYGLVFDQTALVFGMIANAFAAFKGSENSKLMSAPGIKDRFAGIGNQFAVTEVLAFLVSLPVMVYAEGHNWNKFVTLFMSSKDLQFNLIMSGLTFYLYNELATMTIKKVGPVTNSVANTAKRVIVMLVMAALPGAKPLTEEQQIGAAVAIGGVMLYSLIDDLLPKKKVAKKAE